MTNEERLASLASVRVAISRANEAHVATALARVARLPDPAGDLASWQAYAQHVAGIAADALKETLADYRREITASEVSRPRRGAP